jgi:hypothetical protein
VRRAIPIAAVAAALAVPGSAGAATPTQTSLSCVPSPVATASATTCTASVAAPSHPPYPLGTVEFTAEGPGGSLSASSCELVLLTGGSRCKVAYTPTAVGLHVITASYQGNAEHVPSGAEVMVEAVPPPKPAKKKCKKGKKLKKVKGKDGKTRKKCVRVKKKGKKRK